MPFSSKKQMKLCYALKAQGKNKKWNCDEWLKQTDVSKLPEYVKSRVRVRSKTKSKVRSRSRLSRSSRK